MTTDKEILDDLKFIASEHERLFERKNEIFENAIKLIERLQQGKAGALEMAMEYGGFDGAHHKMWVIDQMVRNLLTDDEYETEIACWEAGDDGKPCYQWDVGIAP